MKMIEKAEPAAQAAHAPPSAALSRSIPVSQFV
jgi:hypothetical protein